MSEENKVFIKEFSPLIGVWVDETVSKNFAKLNIDIHEYFKMILHRDTNRLPKWRYLNLNEKYSKVPEDKMYEETHKKCYRILEQSGSKFLTSSFIADFSTNTVKPNGKKEIFSIESILDETEWYQDVFAELSESPRDKILTYADLPRYILSFVSKPTEQKNLIVNLPQHFQQELSSHIKEIYRQYVVTFSDQDPDTVTLTPKSHPVTIKFDKEARSNLFSYSIMEKYQKDEPKKESNYCYSKELHEEIVQTLKIVLETRIPYFINSIIPEMTQKKQQALKASTRFTFFSSSKQQNEDYPNIMFRMAIDQVILGNLEAAKMGLTELLSIKTINQYSKLWEVKFFLFHILTNQENIDYDVLEQLFYELIPSNLDFRILYLLMYITTMETRKGGNEFTKQQEMFLRKILNYQYPKLLLLYPVIGMCYERIAGVCLMSQRLRHAALLLLFARDFYGRKLGNDLFAGHALRCAAFVQHLLTLSDDHGKVFGCGMNNMNLLNNSPVVAHASWEQLNARSLKVVAKFLNRCDLNEYLPFLYFYLFSHCYSDKFAEKIFKGMMDSLNRIDKPGNEFQNIKLPYFIVNSNATLIPYGTPEYFGYKKEWFDILARLWEQKTRETDNYRKKWGIVTKDSQLAVPYYIVCNEPAFLKMEIFRENAAVPLRLGNIHVVSESLPNSIKLIEPKTRSNTKVPFESKTKKQETTFFNKNKTEIKMPLPDSSFIETPFCDEFTSQTTINARKDGKQQKDTLKLTVVPKTPSQFTIESLSFSFWDIATMNVATPQFLIQSLSNQPSLYVTSKDFPKVTAYGEISQFTITVSNIGDAPVKRLFCVHDSPFVIHITENRILNTSKQETATSIPIAIEPIITDPENGIGPGEEIELSCYLIGQSAKTFIHMLWYFEGNPPLTWRSFARELVVDSNVHEIVQVVPYYDPRDRSKLLLYTTLMPTDEDVKICGAKYMNRKFKKFNGAIEDRATNTHDGDFFTSDWGTFLLEEENQENDGNPQNDDERWRNSFIDPQEQGGFLLCKSQINKKKSRDYGLREEELSQKDQKFMKQHQIPRYGIAAFPLRFNIECNTKLEIEENEMKTVPVTLIIINQSKETIQNISVLAKRKLETSPQILFWVGHTSYHQIDFQPNSSQKFNFELLIRKPGYYNVSSFCIVLSNGKQIHVPFKHYITVSLF